MLSYRIQKRDLFLILIIFTLALLFRAMYLLDYKNTNIFPLMDYSDADSYSIWAKDIVSQDLLGSSKAFMKWPFYAYFLSFLFKLSGNNILSVYTFQFILGAINCVLVYFIAKTIFNEIVAFIAALLCVCYGLFIFYDGLLIYTSLSLFLNLLLFLFILYIKDNPNKKNLFWLGIFLGICTITQANIIIFGTLAIVWILWNKQKQRQESSSVVYLINYFLLFSLGLFIVIGPVTLRNYLAEKDFVLIAGNIGFNFYSGNNPGATGTFYCPDNINLNQEDMFRDAKIVARMEAGRQLKTSEVSTFWFNKAIEFIRRHPLRYLKLLLRKITYLLNPNEPVHDLEFYFIKDKIRIFKLMFMDLKFIMPLGILGVLLGIKNFKKSVFLYLILITLSFSIVLFFITTRYRMALVPFLVIFASRSLISLWDAFREKRYFTFGRLCAVLILIFILVNYNKIFNRNIEKNLQNNFSNLNYHFIKALTYENNSDYRRAIQELNSAYNINPLDRRVLFRLGVIYFYLKDLKTAEEKFKEVIKICPFCVDAYYNLGFLYNQQGRFAEAVGALERSIYLDPENMAANFELGRAYKSTGKFNEAKQKFELALQNISRWRTEDRKIIEKELAGLK